MATAGSETSSPTPVFFANFVILIPIVLVSGANDDNDFHYHLIPCSPCSQVRRQLILHPCSCCCYNDDMDIVPTQPVYLIIKITNLIVPGLPVQQEATFKRM